MPNSIKSKATNQINLQNDIKIKQFDYKHLILEKSGNK